MNDAPVIDARDICRSFIDGARQLAILRHVSLAVRAGETVAILGTSGTGKSTLLQILGLLDQPNSGTLFFCGRDVTGIGEAARNQIRNTGVGFVFQHYHLLPDLSVLENVRLPARIAKRPDSRERASRLLGQVGLSDRMHHSPRTLSGGERQRAALARALCNAPKLLLCDEPTGNLDPETAHAMLEILFATIREEQTAAVIVTHDLAIARQTDRILRIRDGELCAEAAPAS